MLSGVNLDVVRGESLGLIGENGAGKSTLLKLITGVLTPSCGSVRVNGTIGALLELGAGFHPEYSGRDNIAMAGALYGLEGADLRARIPDIIAFADIGDYTEMDRVYREFFPVDPPARSVWSMQLRFGNGCKIECVALAGSDPA